MSKHYDLDEADFDYENQYSDQDDYRNNKKKRRSRRGQRNWKTAWLDNQGNDDFQFRGIDRRTNR